MKKIHFQILLFVIVVLLASIFIFRNKSDLSSPSAGNIPSTAISSVNEQNNTQSGTSQAAQSTQNNAQGANSQNSPNVPASVAASSFVPPLDHASERVTKKPFGIYVTPQNSPVQPERFTGFHTGADFETFPDEANIDVAVHVVCQGKLLLKEYASGYGGVAVESCQLNGSPITVVYGHLNLSSITPGVGDELNPGDMIGILGKGYSSETDGERKHLHLGFHKGTSVNILGYVQTKSALSGWIDPCLYVCGK